MTPLTDDLPYPFSVCSGLLNFFSFYTPYESRFTGNYNPLVRYKQISALKFHREIFVRVKNGF